MNFQICGHRTALTSIQLTTKSGATSLPEKSAGYEWFETTFHWYVTWSKTELCNDWSLPHFIQIGRYLGEWRPESQFLTYDAGLPCLWDMTAKTQSKKQKLWCSRGRSGNNFLSFTCSLIATSSLIIYSVGEYSKVPKVFWVLGPAFWDIGRIWQNTPVPIRVTLPNLVALGQIIWAWVPEFFEDGGPRPFGWRTWLTPGKHASPDMC